MTTIWELDYYSRPIVDEAQKKVWEVLICEGFTSVERDPTTLFRYSQYCPSETVNSLWLSNAIEAAIASAERPPDRIRFFRQGMSNMITTACKGLNLPVQISRRTLALRYWLQERMETVYPQTEGYQPGASPAVTFPITVPQSLPDALKGQKWQFVTLAASAFADMPEWTIGFGESFPLSQSQVKPDTPIPGLIIYSDRAVPMAAWMSGLELAALKYDPTLPTQLLLETGINDRWLLMAINQATRSEALAFESAKQQADRVHFLAVQTRPDIEEFAGFWLLQDES